MTGVGGPAEATGPVGATGPAYDVAALLVRRGLSLATAESLTGGMVAAALTTVPGVSAVYRGGVVAYATDLKEALLGVPAAVLAADGAVSEATARAMARGVAERLGADVGVATTGVAGPDRQEGHPAGTVHIAVSSPDGVRHRVLSLPGDRAKVRRATVDAVLGLLLEVLGSG